MEIKRFSDFIICPIPAESELDQAEIEQIVTHTHNTWQHDRPIQEIRENTIQGKRAEIVIENILRDNSTSRFLAYDKMRRDNFNKHAPFDGIIYRNDITTNILQSAIDRINNDVISIAGDSGTITVETREYLETSGIYTIEIKSSLLQHPRDYRCINGDIEVTRSDDNYLRLCEYVKGLSYSSSLDYPLEIEGEIFYPGSSKELWEERQKGNHRRADWAWRWSKKLFQFGYDNGFVVIKRKKDGSARIYTKTYLNAKIGKDSNGNFVIEYNKRVKATSSLEYIDNKYSNDNAKKDLSLFGLGDKFDYSKPVELIKKLIKAYYKNDALILDFFAGSGTTAQAVLELNEEDGGSRRFIVCTNNENNICQEVTYQRIKTVLTGRMASGSEYKKRVKGNLKYYRTDFVDKNSDELVDELLEHIVEMIQLEYGVSINNSQYLIVMDDDEMDDLETNYNSYKNLKAVFLNQDVLLSTSQERMLQNVDTFIIPDYYFDFELREAGELW